MARRGGLDELRCRAESPRRGRSSWLSRALPAFAKMFADMSGRDGEMRAVLVCKLPCDFHSFMTSEVIDLGPRRAILGCIDINEEMIMIIHPCCCAAPSSRCRVSGAMAAADIGPASGALLHCPNRAAGIRAVPDAYARGRLAWHPRRDPKAWRAGLHRRNALWSSAASLLFSGG